MESVGLWWGFFWLLSFGSRFEVGGRLSIFPLFLWISGLICRHLRWWWRLVLLIADCLATGGGGLFLLSVPSQDGGRCSFNVCDVVWWCCRALDLAPSTMFETSYDDWRWIRVFCGWFYGERKFWRSGEVLRAWACVYKFQVFQGAWCKRMEMYCVLKS
jgi:hypothetical protein